MVSCSLEVRRSTSEWRRREAPSILSEKLISVGDVGAQPAMRCCSFFWFGLSAGELARKPAVSTVIAIGDCIVMAGMVAGY